MKYEWDHERGGYRRTMTTKDWVFTAFASVAVTLLVWNFYANDAADHTPVNQLDVEEMAPIRDAAKTIDEITARLFPPAQPKEISDGASEDHPSESATDRVDRADVPNQGKRNSVRLGGHDLQPCGHRPNSGSAHKARTRPHAQTGKLRHRVVAKVSHRSGVQAHGGNSGARSGVRCVDSHAWNFPNTAPVRLAESGWASIVPALWRLGHFRSR